MVRAEDIGHQIAHEYDEGRFWHCADDDCSCPSGDLLFLPALIYAMIDEAGVITGVQRTYLAAEALTSCRPPDDQFGKASVPSS